MWPFLRTQRLLFLVLVLLCVVVYVSFHRKGWVPNKCLLAYRQGDSAILNDAKYPAPKILPCGWVPEDLVQSTRTQCFLDCCDTGVESTASEYGNLDNQNTRTSSESGFKCIQVAGSNTALTSISPRSTECLKTFLQQNCYGSGHTIPRVAHYVRFGAYNLTLDAFISMYSVARFLQPCLILIHGDAIPSGPYWRALLHLLPNMVHVPMLRPREIFGRPINVVQHSSDVARLRIILEYGGMYLDTDQLLLNSFDDLLNESTVLGIENRGVTINNALFLAEPNAQFLQMWLSEYTTFRDWKWDEHSTRLPNKLYMNHSHLAHAVETFFKAKSPLIRRLYHWKVSNLDWARHYGFHFYKRGTLKYYLKTKRLDQRICVIGDIVRYVLYGDRRACTEQKVLDKVINWTWETLPTV